MKKTGKIMVLAIVFLLSLTLSMACKNKNKASESVGGSGSLSAAESINDSESEIKYSEGLEYELNSDGNSYSVVGIGSFNGTELNIPEKYEGKPVTSIGNGAFYGGGIAGGIVLTSVTIPDSVTSVGDWAFEYCVQLTSVTIGKNVASIGDRAFSVCSELANIYIKDVAAWCKISGLNNLMGYSSNKNIYFNGALVTNFVIPDSVTGIVDGSFYGCSGLISITVPHRVTSIGNSAINSERDFRKTQQKTPNKIENSLQMIA